MPRLILVFWLAALLAAGVVLGLTRAQRPAAPPGGDADAIHDVDIPLGDFRLTERSGRMVTRDDLRGKVWVASFVFTCCTTQCPQISGTMAQLHHELADEPDFRLVTFTVDPDRDTPEVLKGYADRFRADAQRWLFLTGKRAELYALIQESFHLTVRQNEGAARTPGNEVMHDFRLPVVDRRGHIRGYFDGRRTDGRGEPVNDVPKLRQKVAELLRERP